MTSGLHFDMDPKERERLMMDLHLTISDESYLQLNSLLEQICFSYIDHAIVVRLKNKFPDLYSRFQQDLPFLTLREINSILSLVDLKIQAEDITLIME